MYIPDPVIIILYTYFGIGIMSMFMYCVIPVVFVHAGGDYSSYKVGYISIISILTSPCCWPCVNLWVYMHNRRERKSEKYSAGLLRSDDIV
jgi:hypothetical protein